MIVNTKECYYCRMCELACSFHHSRTFAPNLSSIHVYSDNKNGEISWSIDTSCDLCQGEAKLLCIQYCVYGAIKEV